MKLPNMKQVGTAKGKQELRDFISDRLSVAELDCFYVEANSYRSGKVGTYRWYVKPTKVYTERMRVVLVGYTRERFGLSFGLSAGCNDLYTNATYLCPMKCARGEATSSDFCSRVLDVIESQIMSIEDQFKFLSSLSEALSLEKMSMSGLALRSMMMCGKGYITKSQVYDVYMRSLTLSKSYTDLSLSHFYDTVSYEIMKKGMKMSTILKTIKLTKEMKEDKGKRLIK